jgi:hypothetical protein
MSERYTTARIPSARSLGAPSVMEGLYLGAELATRSARPGAYDAMKLPSLVNGRQRMPDAPPPAPVEYIPPAPAPRVTARAPVAISDAEHAIAQPVPAPTLTPRQKAAQNRYGSYTPRAGSVPDRVINALLDMPAGAFFSLAEIEEKFDLPAKQFVGTFRTPLQKGALEMWVSSATRKRVISLPRTGAAKPVDLAELKTLITSTHIKAQTIESGRPVNIVIATGDQDFLGSKTGDRRWFPIEDSPAGDPHIAPSRELQDALNELRLREAESHAWQAYVDLLQLRARMSRVARALPFPSLTEPPRLTGAT